MNEKTINRPHVLVSPKHGSSDNLKIFLEDVRHDLRADTITARRPSVLREGLQWLFLVLVALLLLTGVIFVITGTGDQVASWRAVHQQR